MTTAFRNWSRGVRFRPARREVPADLAGLRAALLDAAAAGRRVRVAGSGHSFTPLVATDGVLLSLAAFKGILEVDRERREALVAAGTTVRELGDPLWRAGLSLANQGDIDGQTLAGALATGTHGTGAELGCLATQVVGLTLLTAGGEVVDASATRNTAIFDAARVSLGALGIVTRVRLALRPAYRLREERSAMDLEECLAGLAEARRRHRHHEFFWFPHAERVQVKTLHPTEEPERRRRVRELLEDVLLENAGLWAVCQVGRLAPSRCPALHRLAARLAGEGSSVGAAHRVFPTPRLVRFQEREYAIPADRAADCVRELRAFARERRVATTFPVEVRHVAADDIPLSPFQGRESATVAVHAWRKMPHEEWFAGAEAIFRNHRGRPHWGKLHGLGAAELRGLYPRWDEFQATRRALDPRGLFASPYLDRVLGPVEPAATTARAG